MTASKSEDSKPTAWGPISRNVAANLVRLRKARGLSTVKLAELLDAAGQPIPATGITRIEKGQRRVDTDDLVALADVLNVSPATLLLPEVSDGTPVQLTGRHTVTARTAWNWALGNATAMDWPAAASTPTAPAGDPSIPLAGMEREWEFARQQADYEALTLPLAKRRGRDHNATRLARSLADVVEDLVAAAMPGAEQWELAALARMARRRHASLGLELDELDELQLGDQRMHLGASSQGQVGETGPASDVPQSDTDNSGGAPED